MTADMRSQRLARLINVITQAIGRGKTANSRVSQITIEELEWPVPLENIKELKWVRRLEQVQEAPLRPVEAPIEAPGLLTYLASPYGDDIDAARRKQLYEQARIAATLIMRMGQMVYSPIIYSYPLACYGLSSSNHPNHSYWQELDEMMVARSQRVLVLMLPGWEFCSRVTSAIRLALKLGIPVQYAKLEVKEAAEETRKEISA